MTSQQYLNYISYFMGGGSAFTGLLDTYSGATNAYGMRRLSSSYNGSAINVRRTGGDTLDIGFDNDGNLDKTTLESFVGTGNAFITKWYDQSGNGNDAYNTAGGEQPRIATTGTINYDSNGILEPIYDGSRNLVFPNKATIDNTSIFMVFKSDSNTQDSVILQNTYTADNLVSIGLGGGTTASKIGSRLRVGGANIYNQGGDNFTSTDTTLVSYFADNLTSEIYVDTTQKTLSVLARSGGSTSRIGSRGDDQNYFTGKIQEVVLFDSDESSNRSGIETNINDYYSIY